MTVIRSEIRPGAYFDSAVLMQLQRGLAQLPGVADAGVVMATPANCDLLEQSGLLTAAAKQAGMNDLLIVVRAESDEGAAQALAQVDELLTRRRSAIAQEYRPKSLETAVKQMPQAGWVLISVPGRFAAGVASEAIQLGRHVFLYSDNVSLSDEVALKQAAQAKGLLVMGPDCGTARIGGIGLGFANRVRRGGIGLVGASGTGLQAITSRIHALGAGVSHAIGTGGRDLKHEVGAVTARQGLDILARDARTDVIVLVSKPPAPDVATHLLAAARATGKPVVVDFIGYPPPGRRLAGLHFAATLSEAAEIAVKLVSSSSGKTGELVTTRPPAPLPPVSTDLRGPWSPAKRGRSAVTIQERHSLADEPLRSSNIANAKHDDRGSPALLSITSPPITGPFLRGLFSGGTLAYEAMLGVQALLAPLYSNVPISEGQRLPDPLHSQGHTILDLGEDVFTVGRLHPMLDNDLRLRRLRQEAADPEVGLILLDVVLGEGAHPDPAAELAPVIAEAKRGRAIEVVAIVIGTDEDPQDLGSQVRRLAQAGAVVYHSTTEAVDYVIRRLGRDLRPANQVAVPLDRFNQTPFAAINVGLESFYTSLVGQGAAALHVDWRPPAGGNERLMGILASLRQR